MDGSVTQNSHQKQNLLADQQQTRLLQLNIHRIEKEIEALEREESLISTNEGFILKRLRAVEKSSEDIIKEAKENFKKELVQSAPVLPALPPSYKLLPPRPPPDRHTDSEQPQQTLFAMEINIQKDLRTGESRVVSTATVTPQELEQRGVKVYDDGRKCVYAMRCDGAGLGSHGVDELTPSEVEQLLREATQSKYQREPTYSSTSRGHQGELSNSKRGPRSFVSAVPPLFSSRGSRAQGYGQPSHSANRHKQPHDHNQEVYPRPELSYLSANNIQADSFINGKDKCYQPTNGYRRSHALSYSELYRLPNDNQLSSAFCDSAYQERYPSPIYQDDPPYRILNAMPANQDASESVTAIFMGYQTAEDESGQGVGYDGSIKAELVVIGNDDDEDSGGDGEGRRRRSEGYRNYGYQRGRYGAEPWASCEVSSTRTGSRRGLDEWTEGGLLREGQTDGRQGAGIRKIKKTQKHCCVVM